MVTLALSFTELLRDQTDSFLGPGIVPTLYSSTLVVCPKT